MILKHGLPIRQLCQDKNIISEEYSNLLLHWAKGFPSKKTHLAMEKSSINGALNGKIDYGGFPIAMIDYRKLQVDLGLYYNSVIYDIYIYEISTVV